MLNQSNMPTKQLVKTTETKDKFFRLCQVELFVESLLQFLKEKQCAESLEFVLKVNQINEQFQQCENVEQVKNQLKHLFQVYIEQGSDCELNLSNLERMELLKQYSEVVSTQNSEVCQKNLSSVVKNLLNSLVQQKLIVLLQIKEERFNEFENSVYWQQFLDKLNRPTTSTVSASAGSTNVKNKQTGIDLSFRWTTPMKYWSPFQVAQWMKSMGIEECNQFLEHEISGSMIPTVTREEIIQMGITKIGSLKRILKIISETKPN